jgi:hypothetical protein
VSSKRAPWCFAPNSETIGTRLNNGPANEASGISRSVASKSLLTSSRFDQEQIRRQIPIRDVFFLFWSLHASQSKEVEMEWRTAWEMRGPRRTQLFYSGVRREAILHRSHCRHSLEEAETRCTTRLPGNKNASHLYRYVGVNVHLLVHLIHFIGRLRPWVKPSRITLFSVAVWFTKPNTRRGAILCDTYHRTLRDFYCGLTLFKSACRKPATFAIAELIRGSRSAAPSKRSSDHLGEHC